MAISKQQLDALNKEDLQKVVDMANDILKNRKNQRKKELWENVITAIAKYEQEIQPVKIVYCRINSEYSIVETTKKRPGYIAIG